MGYKSRYSRVNEQISARVIDVSSNFEQRKRVLLIDFVLIRTCYISKANGYTISLEMNGRVVWTKQFQ